MLKYVVESLRRNSIFVQPQIIFLKMLLNYCGGQISRNEHNLDEENIVTLLKYIQGELRKWKDTGQNYKDVNHS